MCNCLQDLTKKTSKKHYQNGNPACVNAEIVGTLTIIPHVFDDLKGKVRLSKHAKKENIMFKFCPLCGKPAKGHQHAETGYQEVQYERV